MVLVSKYTKSEVDAFFAREIKKQKKQMIEYRGSDTVNPNSHSRCLIQKALKKLCRKNWKKYLDIFVKEEIEDDDLVNLVDSDFKLIFEEIGPRVRVRRWVALLKLNDRKVFS